ncbi:amidase [Croceicoccus mobilis]|uniref:Amidase n=1 Tax=Croceicoccus mobilis TaxID=1703339 RepID=A0A916Z5H4_9SPHN|nr:amidase [Croceicoccus mobilis]
MASTPPAPEALASTDGCAGGPSCAAAYLGRIAAYDDAGPTLNAVIATNPDAVAQAKAARDAGLPLAGRTVLVKDNVETSELPTTAGSIALAGNATGRDAPLIANLRAAGGVVLGKTNLSEWANIRSFYSVSGWSGVGGFTKNPHLTGRNACGSSSGSGAAVAASLSWAAIGTETDGSITCPASVNGVVGFKPTVGLVSRTHVVPISHSQDTAGPMARSVADAALLLNAIAGSDPADPATAEANAHITDFTAGLPDASLQGVRIGVMKNQIGDNRDVTALFEQAVADMKAAGAEIVEIDYEEPEALGGAEFMVLLHELRADLGAYLAGSPADIPIRSLADAIAFNKAHADEEMAVFDQSIFEMAETMTDDAMLAQSRETSLRLAYDKGLKKLLTDNDVRFLIAPTTGPAWLTDPILGDNFKGSIGTGTLAAVSGTPHLSVPMGGVKGLPVGLSILGDRWDDAAVLRAGAAFEAVRTATVPTPKL